MRASNSPEGSSGRFAHAWHVLFSSFWFLPTVLTIGALITAPLLIQVDQWLQSNGQARDWMGWIYGGGMKGARRLLSAIAAAMTAITTVMFTSQITVLTYIGQEYGSRLVRNFLAEPRNQIAFGTYICTFVYALMVLRTIHKDPVGAPVPYVAVSIAIALAMASLGVLIYSMYNTSRFLQASTIIDYAARDLEDTITRLTDEPSDRTVPTDPRAAGAAASFDEGVIPGQPVHAPRTGYVQRIDEPRLVQWCRDRQCRIRLDRRVGDFVVAGQTVAHVLTVAPLERAQAEHIMKTITLAPQPNIEQDLRYAGNQLVQLALRAASPDRNDLLTAVMCIDRMTAGLCLLAERTPRSPLRYDRDGVPRVYLEYPGLADLADTFLRPLREFKGTSPSLITRMFEMLAVVASCIRREPDREAVRREMQWIAESWCDRPDNSIDRERIRAAYDQASDVLNRPSRTRQDTPSARS